ncbi:MAG: restriction endonuclease subunit S, partial [Gammaproteobacteria bacterium]
MIADLKPYAEYKESGLPWLEQVPGHWESERAKWLFTKMDRPVRPEDEVVTCFRDGMVTLRKNRRLRGFTEATIYSGYQGIRNGDLVIHGMDAFAGAIGVSDSDGKGTPVYNVCQPRSGVNARFYAHLVREMSQSQWILALAKGIRERSTDFRFETFGNQRVPLPPPAEQATIVRFLDWANGRLERAIRAKRKVIALLGEQKQAIIHRAVTRGLDASVPLKPSGIPWLGDIPQHWEVRRVKQVTSILRGKFSHRPRNDASLYDGPYPFIQTGVVAQASKFIMSYSQTLNDKGLAVSKLFPSGTLVMTIAANIGEVAVLTFDACFPDSIVGFVPRASADRDYLYMVFVCMKPELLREAPVNTQGNLNVERIGAMGMPCPPLGEQGNIARQADQETAAFDTAIARLEREIELLREYRTRLVTDVVTGKL